MLAYLFFIEKQVLLLIMIHSILPRALIYNGFDTGHNPPLMPGVKIGNTLTIQGTGFMPQTRSVGWSRSAAGS